MAAETPGPTPEGVLIRRTRESLRPRLPVAEAAKRAGITADTWGHVERGYRTPQKGQQVPVVATPSTLAHMAHAVGLKPDDLARLGALGRTNALEAAEILREMYGPEREVMSVPVDRGTMLLTVPPALSDEDREQVRRQAEDLATYLDRLRQERDT
ncbi:helix-turn-helix domain-containing protein [Nonomuraea sediminis]|uniref:helix-turn-helix domain-containing protein n=1 Tax=Nonomuraea sediminis TaxID=2835864 RepID=UPI001BDBDC11|nr:helix-turn-helix transcriptional regulator [Nonomuraea sediminis]